MYHHNAWSSKKSLYGGSWPQVCRTSWFHTNACHPTTDLFFAADGRCYHPYFSNCVHFAKYWVHLRKSATSVKLFPGVCFPAIWGTWYSRATFENPAWFPKLTLIAIQLTKPVSVVALKRICLVDIARAFCKQWVYKYRPAKTLLSDKKTSWFLNPSRVYSSCSRLLICLSLHTDHRQIGEYVDTIELWQPFGVARWIKVSKARMRNLQQSHSPATTTFTILQALAHSVSYLVGEAQTLHHNLRCHSKNA